MTDAKMTRAEDFERIWLEPPGEYPDDRTWCQHNVWDGMAECEGIPATEYVRADIHAKVLAERDAAVERADVLAQSEAELMQACDDLEAERNAARAEAKAMREALEYVMTAHGEQLTDAFDAAQKLLARGGEGG